MNLNQIKPGDLLVFVKDLQGSFGSQSHKVVSVNRASNSVELEGLGNFDSRDLQPETQVGTTTYLVKDGSTTSKEVHEASQFEVRIVLKTGVSEHFVVPTEEVNTVRLLLIDDKSVEFKDVSGRRVLVKSTEVAVVVIQKES